MKPLQLIVFILFGLSLATAAHAAQRNLTVAASTAQAQKRVALVIGNAAYQGAPALLNPVNDAHAMSDALNGLGFEVIEATDATQKEMNRAITVFGSKLNSQTAALFFYAGHGLQVNGKNYIVPVDAQIETEAAVASESVSVDAVLQQLIASPVNIIILDACRNNPFERSFRTMGGGGLASMDAPKGSFIAYATAPGKTAADGTGKNGLFTQELLKQINETGLALEQVFKQVRIGVETESKGAQTPWDSSSFTGNFYFKPGTTNSSLEQIKQKVTDNRAEIAKLEDEIKQQDAAIAAANQATTRAEADRQRREAEVARNAIEGKLKAEKLKQDQLAAEQKQREAADAERQRLLAAKEEDDKRLAELKAAAEARRKNNPTQQSGDFPTVETAAAEIKRLNERINAIEAGYEKDLAQTRVKVSQRYAEQLDTVNKAQRDEFETANEFREKQERQRADLMRQRNEELSHLNATALAAAEIAPLRDSIKVLSEREYILTGANNLIAELGAYDADAHQFSIVVRSNTLAIQLAVNGNIPLPPSDAKAFKQQWVAGLIRPEAKVGGSGDLLELALVNDADSTRMINIDSEFMTKKARQEKQKMQEKLAQEKEARQYFTDPQTGLTWRRCAEGMEYREDIEYSSSGTCTGTANKFNFYEAIKHAQSEANRTGIAWRIPTQNELLSIVDRNRRSPVIDPTIFPATPSALFWSTTLMGDSAYASEYAMAVDFSRGNTISLGFTHRGNDNVRLVHDGQPGRKGDTALSRRDDDVKQKPTSHHFLNFFK